MKKIWRYFINFWKGIWAIIKSMGNWRGVLSLLIVWLTISGAGLVVLGFVFQNNWLKGIGLTMYAFWLGPFTPLIPLIIALAMLVQRFIFLDRSVSWKNVKEKFQIAFKEKNNEQTNEESEEVIENDNE